MKDAELDLLFRQLDKPALPDPIRKQELRERLLARANREKARADQRRSLLLVALVTALVGLNSNAFTKRSNYSFSYETPTTRIYQDTKNPRNTISTTGTTDDGVDLDEEAAKFNEFMVQYMSGQTELTRISGFTIGGRTDLGTKHVAETSFGPVGIGFRLDDAMPTVDFDTAMRFMDTDFRDMLKAVYMNEVAAFDDTLVADGMQSLTVQRYRFESEEFGPVVIWLGRKPS